MGLWTRVRLPPNPLEEESLKTAYLCGFYIIQGVVGVADQNIFIVDGYRFGSAEDAELAKKELKKIQYFEEKLDGKNMQTLLAVYDKLMDEKFFSTPVGWEYLRKMQEQLRMAGIGEERIRPIPMYVIFAHKQEEKSSVFDRIRPTRKMSRDRKNLRISLGINLFLAVLVVAMFIITLTGETPNIMNYKKAITDQYASWEQELTEREEIIREKEAELMTETSETP